MTSPTVATYDRKPGRLEVDAVLYTASVITRHNPDCPDREKEKPRCDCRKAILTYNSAAKKQTRISARTRSQEKAEAAAEKWLDGFDPYKIERAAKEAQSVTVAKAIEAFLSHKRNQNVASTKKYEILLGGAVLVRKARNVTPRLVDWLTQQGITLVSNVTTANLDAWRSTWVKNDLSAYNAWGDVLEFFAFCKSRKWVDEDPAECIKRGKFEKGNRTAVFSDAQVEKIMEKIDGDTRLKALFLLLRWGGCALVDGVLFNPANLAANNVLRYKRQKTGKLAIITLPKEVADLLRHIPLTDENKAEQPFRRIGVELSTDKGVWRAKLQDVFETAGIKEVETEVGQRKRNAHPHMLRDTCAVWWLRHGMSMHGVAKVLGDSVQMIEKHYLPFVQELEKAHIEESTAILDEVQPTIARRPAAKVVNMR